MRRFNFSLYSVLGLDLAVNETDLVFEDEHLNIIEVFHTNDTEQALQKLEEFKISFPKAMLTNNAAFARIYSEHRIVEIKKQFVNFNNKETKGG
ncbi:hypothetical protein AZG96_RS05215 [Acinetobacter baumannii]|nr:hypothetical protein [Acinetobacter baumannii]